MKAHKQILLTVLFCSVGCNLISQNATRLSIKIDSLVVCIRDLEIRKLESKLNNHTFPSDIYKIFDWYIEYFKNAQIQEVKVAELKSDTFKTEINQKKTFLKLLTIAEYLKLTSTDEKEIYDLYNRARIIAVNLDNYILVCEAQRRILQLLYNDFDNKIEIVPDELGTYKKYALDEKEQLWYKLFEAIYIVSKFESNEIERFYDGITAAKKLNIPYLEARFNQMLGVTYYKGVNDYSKSNFFYNNAAKIYAKIDLAFTRQKALDLYINYGVNFYKSGDTDKAIENFKLYIQNEDRTTNKHYKSMAYNWLFKSYKKKNVLDSALYYLERKSNFDNELNKQKFSDAISAMQIKFNTSQKEKQILIEQQKKKQNRNIAIGLGTSLGLASIIAFLLFNNTRKKQKLAEQQKALESQKLATVLKEQELVSIDAMIEGQEKERQRIANDLHDDLGGLMATVKLHFNALKEKQTPELFDKTTTLLDDAYQKIRSIAHAKNSGVIAKQGLLIAIQNMAQKISATNQIHVEVVDHGLEHRLENSLELTIFRIIQELITNVIKHAEATEATIHLTNHEDTLNIMVEDNGKGFNPKQVTKKHKGMGISSIDKRVEHLNGTMTIESEPQKGTTVIIDIPI